MHYLASKEKLEKIGSFELQMTYFLSFLPSVYYVPVVK